jgi:long-subunit acyl-CoA synthetase (AMP-forming)
MLCTLAEMPQLSLPSGVAVHCYETLLDNVDGSFVWPVLDENTATVLCYTSGTTGRPKGVLYSNRSAVLHAMP